MSDSGADPYALDPFALDDPAGLTPDWLTAALRHAGRDVTVTAVDVVPVGTGQMGSSFRLTLTATGDDAADLGPTIVAKLPAADPEARALVAPSYRTEVSFYRDVAADVAVRVPACHLAEISEDATRFTLLLEDLAPAVQGDQLAGCDEDALVAAAVNLAGLHGPSWCDPDARRHAGTMSAADPESAAFIGELMAGAVPTFVERLGDAVSAADGALLAECAAATPTFLTGRGERFALLHGDYRLDNLMFGPDGTVTAVDWQTLGIGLPARDLAYLVSTSVEPAERRRVEERAVEAYHRRLVEFTAGSSHGGTATPPLATVVDDYRYGMLHGPIIVVLGAAYGTPTERGDAMFATMAARICAAIRDHDALTLVGA